MGALCISMHTIIQPYSYVYMTEEYEICVGRVENLTNIIFRRNI